MKVISRVVQFIYDRTIAWIALKQTLKDTINTEDYQKAEDLLTANKHRVSKLHYKEWVQQIKVARDGGVYWKKKNKAVVINFLISILYAFAWFLLALFAVMILQKRGLFILLGLPFWYYISSGWISRYYRMKYGFRIYERDFYHPRYEITAAFVVGSLCGIFAL